MNFVHYSWLKNGPWNLYMISLWKMGLWFWTGEIILDCLNVTTIAFERCRGRLDTQKNRRQKRWRGATVRSSPQARGPLQKPGKGSSWVSTMASVGSIAVLSPSFGPRERLFKPPGLSYGDHRRTNTFISIEGILTCCHLTIWKVIDKSQL